MQGNPLPTPLVPLFPIALDLDIAQEIQKMESGPIDSVTLKSLTLSITATDRPGNDTDDWSFVDEIRVFVESSAEGSALPRVEIASVVAPGAVESFDFVIAKGVNLKPYIDEGSVVEGMGMGELPPDAVSYAGQAVFTVHPL